MGKHAVFTRNDAGCWVDGAFGTDHAAEKVASMIDELDATLAAELRMHAEAWKSDETCEFIGECLDDATEVLQAHTAPGLVWVWEAGDLCLCDETEVEG